MQHSSNLQHILYISIPSSTWQGPSAEHFRPLFGGSEMVCLRPVIDFFATILDLWPDMLQVGLKWFSLQHLLEKSTSMYFHSRL